MLLDLTTLATPCWSTMVLGDIDYQPYLASDIKYLLIENAVGENVPRGFRYLIQLIF